MNLELDPKEVNKESVDMIVEGLKDPVAALEKFKQIRLAGWRAAFEADLEKPHNFRVDADGNYSPEPVQIMWKGYLMRCQRKEPAIFFGNVKIKFSDDDSLRMNEVDEISTVFACYITQLLNTWPKEHVRMQSIFKDVERMCLMAKAVLPEVDADNFCRALVDHKGRAKKRF